MPGHQVGDDPGRGGGSSLCRFCARLCGLRFCGLRLAKDILEAEVSAIGGATLVRPTMGLFGLAPPVWPLVRLDPGRAHERLGAVLAAGLAGIGNLERCSKRCVLQELCDVSWGNHWMDLQS